MSPETLAAAQQRLEELFPGAQKTDLNERTLFVWRRRWLDRRSIRQIAEERGWSTPAVHWHLRRAKRALKPE